VAATLAEVAPNEPLSLRQVLAKWRRAPSDWLALEVEVLGAAAAKQYGPADWDLSNFDVESLSRVLTWFETADDDLLLPVFRHLSTLLPDPRVTQALLSLLRRTFPRPIERATIVALLKRNRDPRQRALAERLGVARELALAEAEEPHLLRFANERDAMLLTMFALPDDRMTRTVTADWLLGFADPLGELMALQLARGEETASAREDELLARHGTAFLHDLFSPAPVRELVFEGGVPVHATVARPIEWSPACSALESLSVISGQVEFVLEPRWRRITRTRPLLRVHADSLEKKAEVVRRFREVHVEHDAHDSFVADGVIDVFVPKGQVFPAQLVERLSALRPGSVFRLHLADGVEVPSSWTAAQVFRGSQRDLANRRSDRELDLRKAPFSAKR